MNARSFHKRIRLDKDAYASGAVCSVTIGVRDRRRVFERPELAAAAVAVLKELATSKGVPVYAYCVMPDHVHILLAPSETHIVSFVGSYKSLVTRQAWRYGEKGSFWQKSFWDHFLRRDEDFSAVIEYVLQNPVRAGMVARWRDYPYAGSLEFKT